MQNRATPKTTAQKPGGSLKAGSNSGPTAGSAIIISSQPHAATGQNSGCYQNGLGQKATQAMKSHIKSSTSGSAKATGGVKVGRQRPQIAPLQMGSLVDRRGVAKKQMQTQQQFQIGSRDLVSESNTSNVQDHRTDRGFKTIYPSSQEQQSLYLCGSPIESGHFNSPGQVHRGYSLLNPPTQVFAVDDYDEEDGGDSVGPIQPIERAQKVVSKAPALGRPGRQTTFPDLLFQGYGLVAVLPVSVSVKSQRRHARQARVGVTRRTAQHTRQAFQNGMPEEGQLSSQLSQTEHQLASVKLPQEGPHEDGSESHPFQTQSFGPNEVNQVHARSFLPRKQISSTFSNGGYLTKQSVDKRNPSPTKGQAANLPKEWQPFQTQSISVPGESLEAAGQKTYRTNEKYAQHESPRGAVNPRRTTILQNQKVTQAFPTGTDTYEVPSSTVLQQPGVVLSGESPDDGLHRIKYEAMAQHVILATSSIESDKKQVAKSGRQQRVEGRASPDVSSRLSPKVRNNPATAYGKPQKLLKESLSPRGKRADSQTNNNVATKHKATLPKTVSTIKQQAVRRRSPVKNTNGRKDVKSTSTPRSKGGLVSRTDNSRSPRASNVIKAQNLSQATNKSGQFQMVNAGRVAQNWQNQSQDQILPDQSKRLNKHETNPRDDLAGSGLKQAPPRIQPGLKRFKTQTKEAGSSQVVGGKAANGATMAGALTGVLKNDDGGIETSSFNEDLSHNQTVKIEVVQFGSDPSHPQLLAAAPSQAKTQVAPPNLALLHNVSLTEELGKLSDTGLKGELSIVESDNSAHANGHETPANAILYQRDATFVAVDPAAPQSRALGSPETAKGDSDSAPASPLRLRQKKTQIMVTGVDEQSSLQEVSHRTAKGGAAPLPGSAVSSTARIVDSIGSSGDQADYQRPHVIHDRLLNDASYSLGSSNDKPNRRPSVHNKHPTKVSYLSSTDSQVLAQSSKYAAAGAASTGIAVVPTSEVKKEIEPRLSERKMLSAARESEKFLGKKLSTNPVAPFKRSNTKDESQKRQLSVNNLGDRTTNNSRQRSKRPGDNRNGSSRRKFVAKNMPLQGNQRAKQNAVQNQHFFVDSDFFDSHSVQRPGGVSDARRLSNRFGSTSPVSSRGASTYLREAAYQKSTRAKRRSQLGVSSFPKYNDSTLRKPNHASNLYAGGENLTDDKTSNMEFSEVTSTQPMAASPGKLTWIDKKSTPTKAPRKELNQSRKDAKKQKSLERAGGIDDAEEYKHYNPAKNHMKTQVMLQESQKRVLGRMYQKKFIERREQQLQLLNRQMQDKSTGLENNGATPEDESQEALAYAIKTRYQAATDEPALNRTSLVGANKLLADLRTPTSSRLGTHGKLRDSLILGSGNPQAQAQQRKMVASHKRSQTNSVVAAQGIPSRQKTHKSNEGHEINKQSSIDARNCRIAVQKSANLPIDETSFTDGAPTNGDQIYQTYTRVGGKPHALGNQQTNLGFNYNLNRTAGQQERTGRRAANSKLSRASRKQKMHQNQRLGSDPSRSPIASNSPLRMRNHERQQEFSNLGSSIGGGGGIQAYQPIDQGRGDWQQEADYNLAERGGQQLTSDESNLRRINIDEAMRDESQSLLSQKDRSHKRSNDLRSASPLDLKGSALQLKLLESTATTGGGAAPQSKQFKVPKVKAPQNWQSIIERKYNMVQIEDETYFVPGKASQAFYPTNPHQKGTAGQGQKMSTQPSMRQAQQLLSTDLEAVQPSPRRQDATSPTYVLHQITDRKKSHELSSLRNRCTTDEDRIKKLTSFSVTKKLERQRQLLIQQQSSGRDDPSNVLGYKLMRQGAKGQAPQQQTPLRNGALLEPITSPSSAALGSTGALAGREQPPMCTTLQKNIQGMLSDLNRAKTMRIANQVLKDQQSQMHTVKHHQRRDRQATNLNISTGTAPITTLASKPQATPADGQAINNDSINKLAMLTPQNRPVLSLSIPGHQASQHQQHHNAASRKQLLTTKHAMQQPRDNPLAGSNIVRASDGHVFSLAASPRLVGEPSSPREQAAIKLATSQEGGAPITTFSTTFNTSATKPQNAHLAAAGSILDQTYLSSSVASGVGGYASQGILASSYEFAAGTTVVSTADAPTGAVGVGGKGNRTTSRIRAGGHAGPQGSSSAATKALASTGLRIIQTNSGAPGQV